MDLTTQKPAVTPLFNVPLTTNDLAPQAPAAPQADAGSVSPMAPSPQPQAAQPAAPKKHGALHNILSTLGDFLLDSLGIGDIIKERRLNNAMQGFDQDPTGTIAKVSGIDYAVGAKLRDQYIDNQRLAASNASTIEARNARLAQAQQATDQRTRGYAASMLGSMASWDDAKRQQFYPQMRQQVLTAAQRQGLDLSAELPEKYDSTALDAFIDGSVPVGTQRAQRLTKERNDASAAIATRRVDETVRHNTASEDLGQARLGETGRHNRVTEGQGAARISQAGARAAASGSRVKPIGRYTGSDGKYRVMMSDGTERMGGQTVRPTGKAASAAPTEGMRRVINGATYEWRGGKAVRVK